MNKDLVFPRFIRHMIHVFDGSMKFIDYSGVKFTARQVIGEISGESEKEKNNSGLVFCNMHNPSPIISRTVQCYRRTSVSPFGRDVLK